MLTNEVRDFISTNHKAVLTTYRGNGNAQMSIIVVGPYRDGAAFTTTADRAKLRNLKRDPRCTLLVSQDSWWGFLVFEGHAEILSSENTEAEAFRQTLRGVYRSIAGEHPNWEEYDQAMLDEGRSAVVVIPDRVYGTALQPPEAVT